MNELIKKSKSLTYIYHGTYDGAAKNIQKDGKMKINAVSNDEPYISFSSNINVAKYYAIAKGGRERGVILRTVLTPDFVLSDKFKKNDGHEWVTKKEIPLNELEISVNQQWFPLSQYDFIDRKIISEVYADNARFGLGSIDSYGDLKFKEYSRETFSYQTHAGIGVAGRYRFRYKGGEIDWTDWPDTEQENIVKNYFEKLGWPLTGKNHYPDEWEECDENTIRKNALKNCNDMVKKACQHLLSKNVNNFKIVEGLLVFGKNGKDWALINEGNSMKNIGDVFPHTWIKFNDGKILDPTKKQWQSWGFNIDDKNYIRTIKTFSPKEYLKESMDDTVDGSPGNEFIKKEYKTWLLKDFVKVVQGINMYDAKYDVAISKKALNHQLLVRGQKDTSKLRTKYYQALKEFNEMSKHHQPYFVEMSCGPKLREAFEAYFEAMGHFLSQFPKPVIFGVNEDMSYQQLTQLTTPERIEKSRNISVRSLPVSTKDGKETWNFRYKSSPEDSTTGESFEGSILFLKGNVVKSDDASKLMCKVDCSCPDYMYRFAHNNATKNAGVIGPDSLNQAVNRAPQPAYDIGEGLCKHLSALGRYLRTQISNTKKSNLFETMNDIVGRGPFNVDY